MHYELCIMYYALCSMHYACIMHTLCIINQHIESGLSKFIDFTIKNETLQGTMFICFCMHPMSANIMHYAINLLHTVYCILHEYIH